jgi:hypothetical protein
MFTPPVVARIGQNLTREELAPPPSMRGRAIDDGWRAKKLSRVRANFFHCRPPCTNCRRGSVTDDPERREEFLLEPCRVTAPGHDMRR